MGVGPEPLVERGATLPALTLESVGLYGMGRDAREQPH